MEESNPQTDLNNQNHPINAMTPTKKKMSPKLIIVISVIIVNFIIISLGVATLFYGDFNFNLGRKDAKTEASDFVSQVVKSDELAEKLKVINNEVDKDIFYTDDIQISENVIARAMYVQDENQNLRIARVNFEETRIPGNIGNEGFQAFYEYLSKYFTMPDPSEGEWRIQNDFPAQWINTYELILGDLNSEYIETRTGYTIYFKENTSSVNIYACKVYPSYYGSFSNQSCWD